MLPALGEKKRQQLSWQNTFVNVSTKNCSLPPLPGVSYNKFLAKVASDINKPNGITTIVPEKAQQFIDSLAIRNFFGVGRVTEKKMHQLGISTGSDLRRWDKEQLIFHFGKIGAFLYDIVRGIDNRLVEPQRARKSIGNETTLPLDTCDLHQIHTILEELAQEIEHTLMNKNMGGQTLTLKLRYNNFTTITRSITTKTVIASAKDILLLLPHLLRGTNVGKVKVRLVGVSVSKLINKTDLPRQLKLPFMSL